MRGRKAASGLPSGSTASSRANWRKRVAGGPQRRRPRPERDRLVLRHLQRGQAGPQQLGEVAAAAGRGRLRRPLRKTSRPSCARRSSQSAAARIRARSSNCRRSASASSNAARAAGASGGSSSRDQSSVSVAAITVQTAQRAS